MVAIGGILGTKSMEIAGNIGTNIVENRGNQNVIKLK